MNVGDRVHQGQVICELDQNDLLPRVRQAQASLGMAEASLKSRQGRVRARQSGGAGPDIPFLKRDMDRAREMFLAKVAAANRAGRCGKELRTGQEPPASRRSSISACPTPPSARPKPRWNNRAHSCATTEEDLRNATIISPIDGVVLSRDREVGDAVSSILTMGSGATLIMTVGDLREVYVKGKVDESDIGKVFLGQAARITVESYKGPEIRRQGHEDFAHGRGEGQRHHLRSPRLHLQ